MISLKSELTQKLLNLLFLNPQESFFVNELERRLGLDKRNLVKKLRELETAGLLKSERRGNLRLYSIDRGFPLYKEYERIVLSTIGLEERLKKILRAVPGVKEAYLYGSYAHDRLDVHSDLDLLIVGSHHIAALQKQIVPLQREIGREINAVHMSEEEFRKKRKRKDSFLSGIFDEKTIRLV